MRTRKMVPSKRENQKYLKIIQTKEKPNSGLLKSFKAVLKRLAMRIKNGKDNCSAYRSEELMSKKRKCIPQLLFVDYSDDYIDHIFLNL
ncbi:hypothetical protein A3Q56_03172 [Intoshia linei]|uniref:Uncharacterized protein n=1 Tax=Intoshia linei TaxID=1819745 RepID=A0A177B466_9BILA|nr:hypothetical protein A3Q56_03172 [Intoshia linei]